MNTFVMGWNLAPADRPRLEESLRQLHRVYPFLDPGTVTVTSSGHGPFVATVQVSPAVAAPRVYVSATREEVTLFDGCPVDSTDRLRAHDATDLARHWRQLPSRLEGQFVAARVRFQEGSMELITDPFGVYPVFALETGVGWLVSNSVHLLERLGNASSLDPLGASMFLGMGFVGGDRTLNQGVRVVPAGAHWRWAGPHQVEKSSYYPRSQLARRTVRRLSRDDVAQVADELGTRLRVLSNYLPKVECPITAGRDSRMMVALLLKYNVEAEYFTAGTSGSPDLEIGTGIARHFELSHRTGPEMDPETVCEDWDRVSRRFVSQTDGLATLEHIRTAFLAPSTLSSLSLHLYGAGGEAARGKFTEQEFLFSAPDGRGAKAFLNASVRERAGAGTLLRPEGAARVTGYLDEFVDRALGDGFGPVDVPEVFYLSERLRRWAGNNFRQATPYHSVYSPFCIRPYVEAAFAIPADRRFTEHIPYELLKLLSPELFRFPSDSPWKQQNPRLLNVSALLKRGLRSARRRARSLGRKVGLGDSEPTRGWRGGQRANWLEAKREDFRRLCLDRSSSRLWEHVDRDEFERLMDPRAESSERERRHRTLLRVVTMFQYESIQEGAAAHPVKLGRSPEVGRTNRDGHGKHPTAVRPWEDPG